MGLIFLGILAGLGEFFIGMKLLSGHLKEVAGDGVRRVAGRIARHRLLTSILGLVAGAVTQSTNAVTAAATGLATAEIISVRQAFPLIACANIGTSILVFLAAASLHEAILLATALCGALYFAGYDQSKRWRAPVGAFLALVLIIAGLEMVTSAARHLRDVPEIKALIVMASGSPLGAFVIGAALTPLVQTAKTVSAIVAALSDGGLIAPVDAMMAVVGANLTSALNVAFITAGVSPTGRMLAIYQALLKAVGSAATLPLIVLAGWYAPSLWRTDGGWHGALAVALAYLVAQVAAYLLTMPMEPAIERFLRRHAGTPPDGDPAKPRYIGPEALKDPASATILAFREHLDSLSRLPAHLDAVREGSGGDAGEVARLADGTTAIMQATERFLQSLSGETNDDSLRQRVGSLQRLASLATALQEEVCGLARIAAAPGPRDPEVAQRLSSMVESAHILLETFVEFTQTPDGLGREMLTALTGDRADVMEGMRRAVMSSGGGRQGQRDLFDACMCFERMTWLMKRYTLICDEPGSPFRIEGGLAAVQ